MTRPRIRRQPVSPALQRLVFLAQPPEARRVALVVFDPGFAAWQIAHDPVALAFRRMRATFATRRAA